MKKSIDITSQKNIDKLHTIANIENEYYFRYCGQWLTLEDEFDMAKAYGDLAYADTIQNKMIERGLRIISVGFGM